MGPASLAEQCRELLSKATEVAVAESCDMQLSML